MNGKERMPTIKRVTEILDKAGRITIGNANMVFFAQEDYDELIAIMHSGIAAEMALEKIALRVDKKVAGERKNQETPHTKMNPQDLLSQHEVAAEWGISGKALEKWRLNGEGPKYIKLGKGPCAMVRYRRQDILDYVTSMERLNTTQDTYIREQESA